MDKNLIKIKLKNITEYLEYLEKTHKKYLKENDDFEKIILKTSMAKFIEEIVENAIKINTIILKENKLYAENYYQSFNLLKKILNLDEDFIEEIAKTTSFRNNIVHNYNDIITQKNIENNIEPIIYLYKQYYLIVKKIVS